MILSLVRLKGFKTTARLILLAAILFAIISFLLFGTFVELRTNPQDLNRDFSNPTMEEVLLRLEKLEKEISQLKKVPPLLESKRNVMARKRHCPISKDWRYPFCERKVEWLRRLWNTNPSCYLDRHNVDPLDDCSMLFFLSEVESWCPILPGREIHLPHIVRKKAHIRTDVNGLLYLLREEKWKWMRDRITRLWPIWVEGAKALQKRKIDLDKRLVQNILLVMGSFSIEPLFFYYAYHGGPLGELVQWSDLLATLYILGHNLTINANRTTLPSLLNVPKTRACASKATNEFDRIYMDYNGHKLVQVEMGPNYSQYRCRERILDSFGTDAEFNLAEYGAPLPGGKSAWANADVNLRQIMTMFPHSPDNSFLGFVVDAPVKSHRKAVRRKAIGLVYGKEARFWEGHRKYLDTLHKYLELHATVAGPEEHLRKWVPHYVINHGILSGGELQKLLGKTMVFIGLGFPYEGPAPLEAIARGCVFLNAKLNPPHNRLNTNFFKNKPTLRSLTSQHPYAELFIGKPHVFTVDITNTSDVNSAIQEILKLKVSPYLPFEWTPEGMLERLNAFIENIDFCSVTTKPWPPLDQNRVHLGNIGESCRDLCSRNGLLCEPSYFKVINSVEALQKFNITCKLQSQKSSLDAPSYSTADQSCVLQTHPLLFSCVASDPQRMRLCPCRDFQKQQVALCKKCS